MKGPLLHVPGQHAAAGTVLVHQQVERQIFDEELGAVLQALLVERMQHGVARSVGRCAGALRHLLAIADGLAAKWSLVNSTVFGAGERNTVMFQLEHRGHRLPAHVLNGILIAEPVGTLDRVVHVEAPVVAVAHVSERSRHAALRRHGVAARRKHLCDAGRFQSRCSHSERRAQSCPARTDDHDVIAVLDDFVSLSLRRLRRRRLHPIQ